jgi:hypothetical protein
MSKLIVMGKKKYKRVESTTGCSGCVALAAKNKIACNAINKAAYDQHKFADCLTMGTIYKENEDV